LIKFYGKYKLINLCFNQPDFVSFSESKLAPGSPIANPMANWSTLKSSVPRLADAIDVFKRKHGPEFRKWDSNDGIQLPNECQIGFQKHSHINCQQKVRWNVQERVKNKNGTLNMNKQNNEHYFMQLGS